MDAASGAGPSIGSSPSSWPTNPGRPQTASWGWSRQGLPQIYGRLNVGDDHLALLLPSAIAIELGHPLPFEFGRRFPLQNKLGPICLRSLRTLPRRWSQQFGAGEQMVAKLVTVEHRVKTPTPTLRAGAVHRLQNFGPHTNTKQLHPLVRGVQNPRIVPGQATQVRALYIEITRP